MDNIIENENNEFTITHLNNLEFTFVLSIINLQILIFLLMNLIIDFIWV